MIIGEIFGLSSLLVTVAKRLRAITFIFLTPSGSTLNFSFRIQDKSLSVSHQVKKYNRITDVAFRDEF